MYLREQIAEGIGDDRYADTLPDDLREHAQVDEDVDPENIDLAASTGEIYPDGTALRAFTTTLAIAVILWPVLLVTVGGLSPARLFAGDLPFDELLTFTVYWYFAVALAVGMGVSAAYWYIQRAPQRIREHLDEGPLGTFVSTAVVSGLVLLLAALGGWLLLLAFLLALLLGLILSIPLGLYGLLKRNSTAIIVSVGAFVVPAGFSVLVTVWPYSFPQEYYALVATYALAIVLAATLLDNAVAKDLKAYRDQLGEVQTARDLLKADVERLRSDAPADYPVEVTAPDIDAFESAADAEAVIAETFELVDAYNRHLDVRTDFSIRGGRSTVADLLSTASAATHPSRCASPEVATDAADELANLADVCERYEAEEFADDRLTETRVWSVYRELESTDKVGADDVRRLRDARKTSEDRLADLKEHEKFRERVAELHSGLASTFDNPPDIGLDMESVGDRDWESLERYERLLALAQEAVDLRREYPSADLPAVLLSTLREDAVDAHNLDPYEYLVEASRRALDAADAHDSPFDQARSKVVTIARGDPTERAEDLYDLQEVLERGQRIAEFLNRVDHDHPSVEAAEWQDALAMAVNDAFPNVLRPIDQRIQEMGDGLWERSDLFAYEWQEFESLVGSLYADEGYDTEVTTDTIDGGVDVWARSPEETVAVQVKQNSPGNTVGRRVLQQLASTIAEGSADRVVVVTSAEFADTAIEYAAEFGPKMDLVNGDNLVRRLSASDLPPPRTIEA